MSDRDWQVFFALVEKVIQGDGTRREKKARLLAAAEEHGGGTALEELAGWFDDGAG